MKAEGRGVAMTRAGSCRPVTILLMSVSVLGAEDLDISLIKSAATSSGEVLWILRLV